MPPRDFSEDGAANAGSGFDPNFGAAGSQTGGKSVTDFGGAGAGGATGGWESGQQALNDYTQASIGTMNGEVGSGGFMTKSGPGGLQFRNMTPEEKAGNAAYTQNMSGGPNGTPNPGTYKSGPGGFSYTPTPSYMFADGGAIPDADDDGSGDTNGSPVQDAIQKALSTVDGVLAFGRRLHGLGGGSNEGIPMGQQDDQAGSAGAPGNPRFQDGSKSPNVDDRRNESPPGAVGGAVNNFVGKAYSLYDRAANPDNPIDQNNPLAKDLGGDDLSQPNKGAIDTDEDGD